MQVRSELTHLQVIAPRPLNTSAEAPTPVKVRDLFRPKGGWVRYGFNKLYSLIFSSNNSTSSPSLTIEDSSAEVVTPVDETDEFSFANSTPPVSPPQPPPAAASVAPEVARTIYDVTKEHWAAHMVPYAEPQHLSFRTSQIVGIGFPVDHLAILWCKQVLSVTTKLMKKLSKLPTTAHVNMSTLVNYRREHGADLFANANNLTDRDAVIPPIREFVYRNQSHLVFSRTSVDLERLSFYRQLNSLVLTLGVVYNTTYLVDILTSYVVISLLIIATSLLYDLSDKQSHKSSFPRLKSHLHALFPENHLFLGSLEDLLILLIPTQFYQLLRSLVVPAIGAIVAIGAGSLFVLSSSSNGKTEWVPDLIRYGAPFAQWTVSYGAALTLHVIFFTFLSLWRAIVSTFAQVMWSLLRYTIWCDAIRRPTRQLFKPIRKLSKEFSSIFSVETLLAIVSVSSLAVCLVMSKLHDSPQSLSDILLVTSIFNVLSFLQLVGMFVWGVSWPQKPSASQIYLPALALALPVIPLALPSFLFSLSNVMTALANQRTSLGDAFEIFGPDLITSTLSLFFIGYTLLFLHRSPYPHFPLPPLLLAPHSLFLRCWLQISIGGQAGCLPR
jgi:hypothetical protein